MLRLCTAIRTEATGPTRVYVESCESTVVWTINNLLYIQSRQFMCIVAAYICLSLKTVYYYYYYRQACTKRSHASIVFTQWSNNGLTHCPDKREIWHGRADLFAVWACCLDESMPAADTCAKFLVYRARNVATQPPKLSKFRILAINLCLRGDLFAQFLRNSQRLYASTGSF